MKFPKRHSHGVQPSWDIEGRRDKEKNSNKTQWHRYNIGIKHGFSCINIHQVPWEVLKIEAEGAVFNTSQGTWRMLMHWKTTFYRNYCIKTEKHLLHFAFCVCVCVCVFLGFFFFFLFFFFHYFVSTFHRCLANVISTDYARSRAGQYTSRNGSKSVARYDYIESCVAVH